MQKMASAKELLDSLQCAICHDLLCNPKLLSCSHSFCESCLKELLSNQQSNSELTCPVCRQVAKVPGNDVSNFPINRIAKSLVEDFKRRSDAKAERIKGDGATAKQVCTVCDGDDQDIATYYCQNCSEFLCEDCMQRHNRYRRNAFHDTVKAREIEMGIVKRQFACPKHPQEVQQFVCITCLIRICCRCRELEHKKEGHEVYEMTMYEKNQHERMASLLAKIDEKYVDSNNYLYILQEKRQNINSVVSQRQQEIRNAYDTREEQLRKRRDELLAECSNYWDTFCQELEDKERGIYKFIEAVSEKASLVNDGLGKLHLPDLRLAEHTARLDDLESILKEKDTSFLLSPKIAHRAESLIFYPGVPTFALHLGTLKIKDHQLDEESEDPDYEVICLAQTRGDSISKKEDSDELLSPPTVSANARYQAKSVPDLQTACESLDDLLDICSLESKINELTSLSDQLGWLSDKSDISDTSDLSDRPERKARGSSVFANLFGQVRRRARSRNESPDRPRVRGGGEKLEVGEHSEKRTLPRFKRALSKNLK